MLTKKYLCLFLAQASVTASCHGRCRTKFYKKTVDSTAAVYARSNVPERLNGLVSVCINQPSCIGGGNDLQAKRSVLLVFSCCNIADLSVLATPGTLEK